MNTMTWRLLVSLIFSVAVSQAQLRANFGSNLGERKMDVQIQNDQNTGGNPINKGMMNILGGASNAFATGLNLGGSFLNTVRGGGANVNREVGVHSDSPVNNVNPSSSTTISADRGHARSFSVEMNNKPATVETSEPLILKPRSAHVSNVRFDGNLLENEDLSRGGRSTRGFSVVSNQGQPSRSFSSSSDVVNRRMSFDSESRDIPSHGNAKDDVIEISNDAKDDKETIHKTIVVSSSGNVERSAAGTGREEEEFHFRPTKTNFKKRRASKDVRIPEHDEYYEGAACESKSPFLLLHSEDLGNGSRKYYRCIDGSMKGEVCPTDKPALQDICDGYEKHCWRYLAFDGSIDPKHISENAYQYYKCLGRI